MKRNITLFILKKIEEGVVNSVELFAAYLRAGYGATPAKIERELRKIKAGDFNDEEIKKAKINFSKMTSKLKKDGLVNKKGEGINAVFSPTKKGLKKIGKLENKLMPEINYSKPRGSVVILISFDIPENRRRQRDWLRKSLIYLGFSLVHRSVFVGEGKLPDKFLNDLKELGLLEFVEIMEIGKSGTLKNVT